MKGVLTKTQYLAGLECPKYLWMLFNKPEEIRKTTIAEEFTIEEGNKVGELAKNLYPNGIDIPTEDNLANIKLTNELLSKNQPLFEAGFKFDNCYSRADILVPNGKGWDLLEIKASTKVKDKHIHDVSFQKYICEGNGLKIENCFLIHLNNNYRKSGTITVENLLIKEDITAKVNCLMNEEKNRIEAIFEIISLNEPPKAGILSQSVIKENNHDCFLEKCLELPENNVFCLYGRKRSACELYEDGIELIKDIPKEKLQTERQKIQWACEVEGKIFVNKEKINEFLGTLEYPIYYLDFETFSTAIPKFEGLKPFSHVPFQFSIHIDRKNGLEPEHFEYLYKGKGDPRKKFLIELEKILGIDGSIVVYNRNFEEHRLMELAEYFPDKEQWIDGILARIVDLLEPFRAFFYYNSNQQGSASLKAVYPAITGESYEELEIRDGRTAPVIFLKATYEECDFQEKETIRKNLLKYCHLDTLAQVKIVNKLRKLVE